MTVTPAAYELGDVAIDGGLVTKEYTLSNETGAAITLKKIATSCMCTQAKVTISDNESRFFGMEHGGDRNPPIRMEFPQGAKATVTVTFDPAAHGPTGVGPFERMVWLTFSDPAGIKELTFDGTVVN
ncbi:MAG: DUF1573 domain-containing protein [Candidatus Chisholmbacteria bacterium]|nr:DUF1573 domain-containing protein [Candidatus Chisholmbacteria bacterium]